MFSTKTKFQNQETTYEQEPYQTSPPGRCVAGAWTQSPACDLCSIYSAQQAQGANGRGFFAGVASNSPASTRSSPTAHRANDGEYVNSLASQVFVGYNLNSRVGVQFNLPFLYRDYGSTAGVAIASAG